MREIYQNMKGTREWAWKNEEMMGEIYPHTKGMGEWGRTMLLLIETLPGYSLLQVTSIHNHHSLLNHFYCIICKRSWKWYLQIVSPCPEQVDQMWMPIRGGDDCKGNLTILRRILHLDLAKGNPK
jgi:hypothetical protein